MGGCGQTIVLLDGVRSELGDFVEEHEGVDAVVRSQHARCFGFQPFTGVPLSSTSSWRSWERVPAMKVGQNVHCGSGGAGKAAGRTGLGAAPLFRRCLGLKGGDVARFPSPLSLQFILSFFSTHFATFFNALN